jgi:acetyl-CoA carboxylase biotin carboxyl carrier protein
VAKEDKPEKSLSPELEPLKSLYDLMLEKGLDAVELKDEDSRVKLTRRFAGPSVGFPASHPPSQRHSTDAVTRALGDASAAAGAQTIPTPLSGVFYRASSPTSVPFVKDGDTVEAGQTLCIVEAMKVMNEIKAESRCRIMKIAVENGRPVTANQTLFYIESI